MISAIQLWTHLSAESIFKISNESNGHQMFQFNFNIFQRTSSFGYMMMEFMFIATRVAFGQYFMQRCVAMKTLSQVWVFSYSKNVDFEVHSLLGGKTLISKNIVDNWIDTCDRTGVNYNSDDWSCSFGLFQWL